MIFRNVFLKIFLVAFLLIPAFFLNITLAGNTISDKVVSVSDGDTIIVLDNGKTQYKIRLCGIDFPEGGQDYEICAKKFTSDMVFGKQVSVQVMDIDRYD